MGLAITLALLAAGVFLLWVGLTGTPPRAALTSILTTGKAPATGKAK